MINFILGFICGFLCLAVMCTNMTKTHDLTVLHGKLKWINRNDREKMSYEELRKKYNA